MDVLAVLFIGLSRDVEQSIAAAFQRVQLCTLVHRFAVDENVRIEIGCVVRACRGKHVEALTSYDVGNTLQVVVVQLLN